MQLIKKLYGWFVLGGNLLQPIILLIFRLNWGWQFFETGQGKLKNHPDIVEYFASINVPFPDANAWFIGGLECVGGLLLLIGLASRPTAFLLTCAMTGAFFFDPDDRAKVLNIAAAPDAVFAASPFFFWLTSLLVLSFGPGVFSVDGLLRKLIFNQSEKNSSSLKDGTKS